MYLTALRCIYNNGLSWRYPPSSSEYSVLQNAREISDGALNAQRLPHPHKSRLDQAPPRARKPAVESVAIGELAERPYR